MGEVVGMRPGEQCGNDSTRYRRRAKSACSYDAVHDNLTGLSQPGTVLQPGLGRCHCSVATDGDERPAFRSS